MLDEPDEVELEPVAVELDAPLPLPFDAPLPLLFDLDLPFLEELALVDLTAELVDCDVSRRNRLARRTLVDARATQARAACLCASLRRTTRCMRRACMPSWALAATRPSAAAINASEARMLETEDASRDRARQKGSEEARVGRAPGVQKESQSRRRRREGEGANAIREIADADSGSCGVTERFGAAP